MCLFLLLPIKQGPLLLVVMQRNDSKLVACYFGGKWMLCAVELAAKPRLVRAESAVGQLVPERHRKCCCFGVQQSLSSSSAKQGWRCPRPERWGEQGCAEVERASAVSQT